MARLKIDLSPSLSRLDLVVKGLSSSKFIGNYQSVFKGQGLEFADFRVYSVNDDASKIDWKTSSRANQILVKEYIEERNMDIFFLIDTSSKMLSGSTSRLKAEYIADFVASLAHTILKTGDRVGLALFNDKIVKNVFPDNGMNHFYAITNSLSNTSYYGGDSDIKKAVDFAISNLREGDILFIVSDFITEKNFEKSMRVVGHKFDTIAVIVRDPIDFDLPTGKGQVMMQDPVYGERVLISPAKVAKFYARESRIDLRKVKRVLSRSNVDILELNTKTSFIKKLVEFFERRKSQWK